MCGPNTGPLDTNLKSLFAIMVSFWLKKSVTCLCRSSVVQIRGVSAKQTDRQNLTLIIKKSRICYSISWKQRFFPVYRSCMLHISCLQPGHVLIPLRTDFQLHFRASSSFPVIVWMTCRTLSKIKYKCEIGFETWLLSHDLLTTWRWNEH